MASFRTGAEASKGKRMTERGAGWLPVAVALAVVVLWGATPVITKLAAAEIDPLIVGLMRTILGGIAAGPLALGLRIAPPRGRNWLPLLLSGFCGFVAFPILFTFGQRLTSAMHGGLILAALPIFTGLYAALIERRQPTRRWWAGCAVAFAGEVLLILGRMPASAGQASLLGDLLVLLASLFASMGYVAGARLTQAGYASLGTTLWGITAGAIAVAPALPFATGGEWLPSASPVAWGAVAVLAWLTSILGYIGWYWALGHGGIARMGTIQFLQPLSGLVLAFFLLGERPTLVLVIATVLILAGVVVARRR
jgi:drug/metabolite transporter (DMT)-like permease